MALELNSSDQIERDERGRIRSVRHIEPPTQITSALLSLAPGGLSAQQVAEHYLRETTNLFGMPDSMVANLTAELQETTPSATGPQLRLLSEKDGMDSITVTYAQTNMGIPVWNSGVSVRLQKSGMQVITAENDFDYDLGEVSPPPNQGYLPATLTPAQLRPLLGLTENVNCELVKTRLLIYRYFPEERTKDRVVAMHEEQTMSFENAMPELPLPTVSPNILPGRSYVVTEVDFLLPWDVRPQLPWKAFIEPRTGAVLRVRPATASATACVFVPEPSTLGSAATSSSAPATLAALTTTLTLAGLDPVNVATGKQSLGGRFVHLKNISPPAGGTPKTTAPFSFCYPAKTLDFAAASAYHHCDSLFRLVEDMGFPISRYFNGTNFPVPVDHYGFSGQVNAQAPGNPTSTGSGGFIFGLANAGGPMGIAADARIAWHEFGHAILWDHVASPNFGFAHSPGDSLGAILFDPGSKAVDRGVTFPFMAASNGLSRRHDRDVSLGWAWGGSKYDSQYLGEQVLSTTLFRIYRASGGDSTDLAERLRAARYTIFLILKSIESLTMMTTRPEVYANALMDADRTTGVFESTPGGALHKVIRWSFEQQGLYQPAGAPFPTSNPGAPPAVDVYIEDSRHGEYMPYLPNGGASTKIINRHTPVAGIVNQPPMQGVDNFLFVLVSNRGTTAATGVTVQAFQTGSASSKMWPDTWAPVADAPTVLPVAIAPGSSAVVGPISWVPISAQPVVLVEVNATADHSVITNITGTIETRLLTLMDNNIKFRAF